MIGDNILFDIFGEANIFAQNMAALKVNKNKTKHIVLSHDDWDHISGLWNIINKHKDISKIADSVYTTGELQGKSEEFFMKNHW